METTLTIIAVLSTTAAFSLGAILVKMLRDERRRSDARVQALMDVAGVDYLAATVREPADKLVPSHFHAIPEGQQRPAAKRAKPAKPAAPPARIPQPAVAQDLELNPSVAGIDSMFAEPERRSPWPSRVGVAAACAAVVALAGFLLFSGSRTGGDTKRAEADAVSSAPLELLALGHTAEADGLTISGIVQNPRGGTALADVVATASLFGSDGAVVAVGQAPLDFTQLRPGDESPFVVKVPTAAGVARYRVSFKNGKGAVLGHVDRRGVDPVARRQ
jgi:hypothetical protein